MNTLSRLFLCIALLFISVAHAEESAIDVEAKSSDAAPTQEGTISPNNLAVAEKFGSSQKSVKTLILAQSDELHCWSQNKAHGHRRPL